MASPIEELFYDYTYNLFLARTLIAHLRSSSDRQKVVRWMAKLSSTSTSVKEMRLRNDFLYFLVHNIQAGELRPPFNENPPIAPIIAIPQLLPGDDEHFARVKNGPVRSRPRENDTNQVFMVGKAVPACGAYCYMAVCSKAENE